MYPQHIITPSTALHNIPIIDGEFDLFEMNTDLMSILCGADVADFYHDAFDIAE